jgi:capsid portal protein
MYCTDKVVRLDFREERRNLSEKLITEILEVLDLEDRDQRKLKVALWLDKLERSRGRLSQS